MPFYQIMAVNICIDNKYFERKQLSIIVIKQFRVTISPKKDGFIYSCIAGISFDSI